MHLQPRRIANDILENVTTKVWKYHKNIVIHKVRTRDIRFHLKQSRKNNVIAQFRTRDLKHYLSREK